MIKPPLIRAILFEAEPEWGSRSVLDIIAVEGFDSNAKRRLRRRIINLHGDCYCVDQILYEEVRGRDEETISYDVTKRFKKDV